MNTLKEKCKILKDKFDIDYFCLTMIDDDNRSIISNIDEFDEVYISEKIFNYAPVFQLENSQDDIYYIWDLKFDYEAFNILSKIYGVKCGIGIHSKILSSNHVYYFFSNSDVPIKYLYLLHMNGVFYRFVNYILEEIDDNNLRFGKLKISPDHNIEDGVSIAVDSSALNNGLGEKFSFQTSTGSIILTQSELDILRQYIKGLSAKEISRVVNKSYRTVEGYISRSMRKLMCDSKNQLIINYSRYLL
ncbi:MAG: helix-turn-helix transcriptional regulator [Gammaproteobacteria bacterium]|nr:helix-turn-helix transcriptional regulator [Gammaproteobacteria bacterium]